MIRRCATGAHSQRVFALIASGSLTHEFFTALQVLYRCFACTEQESCKVISKFRIAPEAAAQQPWKKMSRAGAELAANEFAVSEHVRAGATGTRAATVLSFTLALLSTLQLAEPYAIYGPTGAYWLPYVSFTRAQPASCSDTSCSRWAQAVKCSPTIQRISPRRPMSRRFVQCSRVLGAANVASLVTVQKACQAIFGTNGCSQGTRAQSLLLLSRLRISLPQAPAVNSRFGTSKHTASSVSVRQLVSDRKSVV